MKTLNELKKSDFTKFNNTETVLIQKAEVIIEFDFYNDKWIYSSNDIALSGHYYGSITDFKSFLKEETAKAIGEHLIKYSGYGYHGGGRPKKADEEKRVKLWLSCKPSEKEAIEEKAKKAEKTVSKLILDTVLGE